MEFLNRIELRGIIGDVKQINDVYHISVMTEQAFSMAFETIWHNVSAVSKNVTGVLEKGKWVYVEGRAINDRYVTVDGDERYRSVVIASKVIICDS